jgi:hypothetical protein
MLIRHEGIVLKNYQPKKEKVAVLDVHAGKIECFMPAQPKEVHVGSLLHYFPTKVGALYALQNVEVIHVPLALARHDLYFFHTILELCYYFLPLDAPTDSLFSLIYFLLYNYENVRTAEQKKIFLLRFFVQVGMYPEQEYGLDECMHYLLSGPVEVIFKMNVRIPEQELERWLESCIETHPQKAKFKTMVLGCDNV